MAKREYKITEQQKLFIDMYLAGRKKNATKAAIEAGYSEKSASSQASQLLNNTKVLEYLKEREVALTQELQQEFLFDALEARKVMYKIMTDEESRDTDKINAAKDFLDRAGFKATEKVEQNIELNSNPFNGLSTEELKKIIKE